MMKLGLGLYRHMLTPDNFRFARQAGATHIIAHLTRYFNAGPRIPNTEEQGWGLIQSDPEIWSVDALTRLKTAINQEGLELEAIENLNPADWYDVLLAGPKRQEQLEWVKQIIRNMGQAGIPILGYNFSIAGVWGHVTGPYARGGAESVGFLGADGAPETPIPNGMVWNMIYDPAAVKGQMPAVTQAELWERLSCFLNEVVPVAEAAGVRLAAHPDDPPMPSLRGAARLVYQPDYYQDLLGVVPSGSNALEFCVGSLTEMTEGNIYQAVEQYSRQNAIAYVHLRNVRGKVPRYHEVFIDEGDVDIYRVMKILHTNGFDGVLIPDHTPQMTCDAPWHAGMAFALGYMKAILQILEREQP